MVAMFLGILLALTSGQTANQISNGQKREFVKLLRTLPFKGEFYTDEAVEKASPYLPVLFALTEKDFKRGEIYPFVAISRGLCDRKKHRDYAVVHFGDIRHPTLKLFWAAMLFKEGVASSEIVRFLKGALESKGQAETLSQMAGPNFEDFKRRVAAHPVNR